MEAGFLGAAAAPEPQVRPDSLELNRARAVCIPSPAIRGRADFSGVDSEEFLRAAAAARASERCGPGHGETMRARTLPARSALPLHLSRTLFPTATHARSSLSCAQTLRLHDPNVCGATVGCEIFMRVAHHARLCGAACRGRKATLYVCMSHVLRGICPARASVHSRVGECKLRH